MAEKMRPVWIWLPEEVAPVVCGTFEWSPEMRQFAYAPEYRARADALPVDPSNLPFSRSTKPAYDIVAISRRREDQAMALNRKGTRIATPETLIVDAHAFSYGIEEAWDTLCAMAETVWTSWRALFATSCGLSEEEIEIQRPAFRLAEDIASERQTLDVAQLTRRRR